MWDDKPLNNQGFAILYPIINIRQVNYLERKLLSTLQYKLTVTFNIYICYQCIYTYPPTLITQSSNPI